MWAYDRIRKEKDIKEDKVERDGLGKGASEEKKKTENGYGL